jgi:adenylate cyclase
MGLDNATTLGVVQVINKRRGVFNRQDEMLLKAFSHQAAVAVENFSLYRRMVASHERMAILLDVAISISQTLDLATLISKIVGRLTELLACERSSFFVLDHDAGELWSMEAHGSELKEIRFPASAGLAGHAATHAELVNVVDAYEDERFNPAFDRQSGFRTRSVLCVPVMSRDGRVTGVTQAINKRGAGAFDAEDVELLKAISSQLGVTVENAKLHADAVNMRNYLKSVQESISNGIVTVDADFRLVTANHAAAQILDLPAQADALKHADLRELCGPGAQPLFTLMQAVYEGRASVIQYDVELRGAAGERAANINVLPLTDADGDFQGLVVVLEDVTQAKRVKSTLTRYMAQDIVERMLADPSQQTLGGVRGTATVLFSDIRHFTSIAERLSAEQTMDMLNEYFGLMVEEVLKERGVLDKFIGDAMMAVFGVPYAQADDAVRAVRTALAMRKALARFNASWTARGHPPIQIGIGINTDDVISGNMGSQKRMDYTVIGDGVNVASRMEGLNKEYGTMILITETTRALIGDEFKLRCIDRVIVKGKSEPIEVYEVLGDREHAPSPFEGEFASGLDAYRSGDFQRALALFRQVADIDRAAQVFAARCETLLVQPPGPGWMGVWAATSK